MSGLYLHIPFCKQACHYCDFHFSTSLKKKEPLLRAMENELQLRKNELKGPLETIYFGGGTPSLLTSEEIARLLSVISDTFSLETSPEITLEANPDDLSEAVLEQLAKSRVNRLSIGVQSFFEQDLKLMNRAHTAGEAWEVMQRALDYFENVSMDLIYGIPDMSLGRWEENLEKAFALKVPHLSCYALTVEPRTALKKFIEKGIVPPVEDEAAQQHHELLVKATKEEGYVNYEFSNFGKPGYASRNNQGYWLGKPYLGIGPSAHSYDGRQRSWNIANNAQYIRALQREILPIERETLTKTDRYNEYVMTRLRLQEGMDLNVLETTFGTLYRDYAEQQAATHIAQGYLLQQGTTLRVSEKGKFLSDGIASDLFLVHLNPSEETQ
ncbi:radical SAM family heme chaperone HemW [Altibacter sp. HG106]|uniref:radical SAM family heme chaperone HemW n=1 Tax=Altibacter sp. HG106 TaxID=3023937 RepID=UPI002350FE78|nr:radical SAM family heme chaperone HemW [Altibacter sp. HG106]MDC7994072.1 radical SAM family heme chaperone HemW [Altibacter sp. HG106]